jgi:hypothetical protein
VDQLNRELVRPGLLGDEARKVQRIRARPADGTEGMSSARGDLYPAIAWSRRTQLASSNRLTPWDFVRWNAAGFLREMSRELGGPEYYRFPANCPGQRFDEVAICLRGSLLGFL